MNLDAQVMPLGVILTSLKDEDDNFILCTTVCVLGNIMKDCKNCKQIKVFIGETNVPQILG
jgi:hypothetical protein